MTRNTTYRAAIAAKNKLQQIETLTNLDLHRKKLDAMLTFILHTKMQPIPDMRARLSAYLTVTFSVYLLARQLFCISSVSLYF